MERAHLGRVVVADQGDEGLGLSGHGALVDDDLLDIELLQAGGRCG